jgi:hypothetical protein
VNTDAASLLVPGEESSGEGREEVVVNTSATSLLIPGEESSGEGREEVVVNTSATSLLSHYCDLLRVPTATRSSAFCSLVITNRFVFSASNTLHMLQT